MMSHYSERVRGRNCDDVGLREVVRNGVEAMGFGWFRVLLVAGRNIFKLNLYQRGEYGT
jgi:hypothetical protein